MIAIVRKNVACYLKHNSFVCKSPVSSPNFFSTWRERQFTSCPKIYDLLLHKHQFSPEVATLVASNLGRPKYPENADSMLSFLKESGCSTAQLQKIVKYDPRILFRSVEDIKLKIKIFKDLGLSPEDIAKMISGNQVILHLSTKSNIIPSLSVLKGLLGSDDDVARLLRKSVWTISADLDNTLVPNVEFLKSCGISMECLRLFLYSNPRCLLLKPDILRKSVDKAKEMGFSENSKRFIYAVRTISSMSQGLWETKLQELQDLGFSETDILMMFNKFPYVLFTSIKKIEKIKQLLLDTGKFNMSTIVKNPVLFSCSIEKRLEPRLRVLEILESNNLLKKWPSLGVCYSLGSDKFSEKYIRPYLNVVSQAFDSKQK